MFLFDASHSVRSQGVHNVTGAGVPPALEETELTAVRPTADADRDRLSDSVHDLDVICVSIRSYHLWLRGLDPENGTVI